MVCVCVYIYMHACIHTYTYTHTRTHTHTHLQTYPWSKISPAKDRRVTALILVVSEVRSRSCGMHADRRWLVALGGQADPRVPGGVSRLES